MQTRAPRWLVVAVVVMALAVPVGMPVTFLLPKGAPTTIDAPDPGHCPF
jgi:hypothetical protein